MYADVPWPFNTVGGARDLKTEDLVLTSLTTDQNTPQDFDKPTLSSQHPLPLTMASPV